MLVVGCFLVKSCRLITLIKYLKGRKYLGLLLKGIVHHFFSSIVQNNYLGRQVGRQVGGWGGRYVFFCQVEKSYRGHMQLLESILRPVVYGRCVTVQGQWKSVESVTANICGNFYAKNTAKICTNFCRNICGAKNTATICASLKIPQNTAMCVQTFAKIYAVQNKNTNIYGEKNGKPMAPYCVATCNLQVLTRLQVLTSTSICASQKIPRKIPHFFYKYLWKNYGNICSSLWLHTALQVLTTLQVLTSTNICAS